MSKSNLADRLIQELTACRAEGGDHYPIRLDRLIGRIDPAPEPAAVLKSVGNKSFTAGAVVAVKDRMDAPVALLKDAPALAASPLALEVILRAKGEKEGPPWTPAKLAQAVPKSLRGAFTKSLNRQIEADELPAFVVRVSKGKSVKLHHRDQSLPPAPEVQDAERLLDVLRRREQPGTTLTELQSAAGLKPTAFKKAVKQPAFSDAVIQVKPGDVFLLPNGDEFRRLVTGALLARLLSGCKRTNAHAFPVKELVALVSGKAIQQSVAGQLNRSDLANDLPVGVGCVLVSTGKRDGQNVFFLLEDVRTAKPPARTDPAPEPARAPSVDFVTAFDAAFARLDRERGSNNFVSLVDLRAALPNVPRETFDAELHELRRARRYILSSDERYDGITPEQQAAAIREEGEFLLHVSRGRQ